MKISIFSKPITGVSEELLCLPVFEDKLLESNAFSELNASLGGGLAAAASAEGFSGALGQELHFAAQGRLPCPNLLMMGLGPRDGFELPQTIGFGQRAVDAAVGSHAHSLGVSLPPLDPSAAERATPMLVQGLVLGDHALRRQLGKQPGRFTLGEAKIVVDGGVVSGLSVSRGELLGRAVCTARDLVNASCATLTPAKLAQAFQELTSDSAIRCSVLGPRECEKLGLRLFLSACSGPVEPRLVHVTYRPKGRELPTRRYALVGGGVTRLPLARSAAEARAAKAGAAAVLGALTALPTLGVQAEVHGIIAAGEVLEAGAFPRPGDLISGLAGRTVELAGPANGPLLILADALSYAARMRPDELLSLAAVGEQSVRALGRDTATIVGVDRGIVERFLAAARRVGEEAWQLPLPRPLAPLLASELADVRLPLPGEAEAVSPGLFLREFCARIPWAHVDLAATATLSTFADPARQGLATGFAVTSLIDLLAARDGLC